MVPRCRSGGVVIDGDGGRGKDKVCLVFGSMKMIMMIKLVQEHH